MCVTWNLMTLTDSKSSEQLYRSVAASSKTHCLLVDAARKEKENLDEKLNFLIFCV